MGRQFNPGSIVRWLLVIIVIAWMLRSISPAQPQYEPLAYSEFLNQAQAGNVAEVRIDEEAATGKLKDGTLFRAYLVPGDTSYLALLREKGVTITVPPRARPSFFSNLLVGMLPFLLIMAFWLLMMRQVQGGANSAMTFGKSRAKLHNTGTPKVTFRDVAGVEEAKEELQEVIEFLKSPKKFQALGAKIPRGVLLVGPPGSGKTMLAKAVAGEAGVPFYSISGSEFVEMFVGVGASRVRDLFEQAKKSAPCLIFIDELDAVGRQRGAGLGGGHDEREQTLNQLLVEMDGFDPHAGIIMIAATNRPDILDPALLRPGRFDRRVVVDNPDQKGRRAILEVHARGKPLEDDVDLDFLAKNTGGFSGADLANVMNEAALLAARRDKKKISQDEIEEAVERVIAGPQRKSRVLRPRERELVAYHEAGHALLGSLLEYAEKPKKITIIPRGMALGYVLSAPEEDKYIYTRAELFDKVTAALGGRVAEEIQFNEITTGAANDFGQATQLVRRMVTEFGMSELGPLALGTKRGPIFLGRDLVEERNYSDETAHEIDQEVRRIVGECYGRAKEILVANHPKLERIAKALLKNESLDAKQLEELLREPAV